MYSTCTLKIGGDAAGSAQQVTNGAGGRLSGKANVPSSSKRTSTIQLIISEVPEPER